MPYYHYELDKKIADKTELQVADIICSKMNCELVDIGLDNKWDLKFKKDGKYTTVEVKEDFTCERTGNVGLEFSCRGSLSGISVSQADLYCYKLHEPCGATRVYLIKTDRLKQLINDKQYFRIVNGGDFGSNSLNYLFKLSLIQSNSVCIGEASDD